MSKDKAPREFWVIPEDNVDIGRCYSQEFDGTFKVIEHSAYAALEAKLAECVAALEFYADYKSWAAYGYSDEFESIIKDSNKCKDRDHDIIGGRRAREVLAKVKK